MATLQYLLVPCTSEVELELGSSLADKQTRRGAGSTYLERSTPKLLPQSSLMLSPRPKQTRGHWND